MHPGTRACVAAVASMVANGKRVSSVYDYSAGQHRSIGGHVTGTQVALYDYERGCHFSGNLPSLYDYGESAHVQLTMDGNSFRGYDYGVSAHFSGSVTGSSVSIYDYQDSNHYSFSA